MLEDINELLVAHDQASTEQGRITLLRYALVVLHSFDELAGEFQGDLRTAKLSVPDMHDRTRLQDSLSDYHRAISNARSDLAAVRHTLGAHRGLPSAKEKKRFGTQFDAWGEWESTLVALENRCERSRWQPCLEAAFNLNTAINDVDMGRWYSAEGRRFSLQTPWKLLLNWQHTGGVPDAPHNQRMQRTVSRVTALAEKRKRRATRPRR